MAVSAQSAECKSFENPDEVRSFPHGELEIVRIAGTTIGKAVFQPGWRWSESVKPIVKTQSCQTAHVGYVVAGRMAAKMDDGAMLVFKEGDAMSLPPGHDAWVEGPDPCIVVDFGGAEHYAQSN